MMLYIIIFLVEVGIICFIKFEGYLWVRDKWRGFYRRNKGVIDKFVMFMCLKDFDDDWKIDKRVTLNFTKYGKLIVKKNKSDIIYIKMTGYKLNNLI